MRHVSIHKRAIFVAIFASISVSSNAQSACFDADLDVSVAVQIARLSECQNNPRYLARLGHLLNQRGNYLEALGHLERALMFDPNTPEVQLDYAIALAGTGDPLSASQLLDGILTQPDLSPTVRQTLVQARQRLTLQDAPTADIPAWPIKLSANLRQGHDSNLLGATHTSSLALTLPGQVVVLQLVDGSAPRAGDYARADVRLDMGHNRPNGSHWEFSASAMQRESPAVPEANTGQTELALDYSPAAGQPWAAYFGAFRVDLRSSGGIRYTSHGLASGWQLPTAATPLSDACGARLGVEWQERDLSSAPILSGIYTGISTLWACNTAAGGQWQLTAKAGQDRPHDPSRPGGDQAVANLRSVVIWPTTNIGLKGGVLFDVDLVTTRDTTGYSPLLDNSALRQTNRVSARLEYQRPVGNRMRATVGGDWSYQDSNLPLFRTRSWGPYATLQLQW